MSHSVPLAAPPVFCGDIGSLGIAWLCSGNHDDDRVLVLNFGAVPRWKRDVALESNCDALLRQLIAYLRSMEKEAFSVVFLHDPHTSGAMPAFTWFLHAHEMLTRKMRKRLKQLYIIRPTLSIRAVMWFLETR